jgi:hypothetical protein
VWLDHRNVPPSTGHVHSHGAASTAGAPEDGVAKAQKSSIYYASIDGAQPRPEQEIAKGVCYCCKTSVAVTPRHDVYTVWRHVYPGNLRDMAFTAAHPGSPFNPIVRVSEDGWQITGCPDDGPAMVVDPQGAGHVVWPTVYPGDKPRGAIFYAVTRDSHTFEPRIEVPTLGSVKPAHPQIVLGGAGTMVVAWDEQADRVRVAAARTIGRNADGAPRFGPIIRLAEGATYYPVLAATRDGFVAAWTDAAEPSSIGVRRLVR